MNITSGKSRRMTYSCFSNIKRNTGKSQLQISCAYASKHLPCLCLEQNRVISSSWNFYNILVFHSYFHPSYLYITCLFLTKSLYTYITGAILFLWKNIQHKFIYLFLTIYLSGHNSMLPALQTNKIQMHWPSWFNAFSCVANHAKNSP